METMYSFDHLRIIHISWLSLMLDIQHKRYSVLFAVTFQGLLLKEKWLEYCCCDCCITFYHFCQWAVSKRYVGPRTREVCFWVIYHRHPGLPACLITLSLTKSQSTSGPGAGGWRAWGGPERVGERRAVCLHWHLHCPYSPSTFYDGIAYRMRFLFEELGEKVGETPWKTKYYILISAFFELYEKISLIVFNLL